MNPVLVEVRRGCYIESVHAGAVAVVDVDGAIRLETGDIERPVFPRSAVKVFQALPLVASGAADGLGLTDEELALSCASHTGEPSHVATAAAILAKAGMDETVLECGAHWPSHVESARALACDGGEPSALHNNCSGKHAGFVCVGCLMARAARRDERDFLRGYVDPRHPVMREVSEALQAVTGANLATAPMGIDGCSIPTYGIALRQVALGFARVATGIGLNADHVRATRRLRAAVARAPFMVAGSGRFGTRVMERLGERVFCKSGAEGVYCAALPEVGLGVAIKSNDGNARAAEVVMAAVIEELVRMDDSEREFMRSLSAPVLKNWNGMEVGELHPSPALRSALGSQA